MQELTGAQRKYLRGLAHHIKPLVQVGKKGVTENLIYDVESALDFHELIKIKFLEYKKERKKLSAEIGRKTRSDVVGIIGNVAVLYKENPDEDKRKIKIPKK